MVGVIGRRQFLRLAAAACPLAILPRSAAASALVEVPASLEGPSLDIPDLGGKLHRLADYRGKVTVVAFWAAWCPPCRAEIPSLARLSRQLPAERFAILAVNLGDTSERIGRFLDQIDDDGLSVLTDLASSLASAWHIRGLPVSYVLDPAGQVRYAVMGSLEWDSPAIRDQLLKLGAS
ncbi:TlpA family protein disulfide reductase [Chelativorans xinjiangense]|uniref:TlpA family protein disulfide reductase n=1 Tax=Chelativorans xinjiangense TaxID=2681485 RepID=UPI00135939BC|nr:TlpA disulfide reductase family protein [Chelativorans xinjiangense]